MRQRRVLKKNAEYHCTGKFNRNEFIMEDDTFKDLFLVVIKEAMKKYHFTLKDFCLMGNHYHLRIKPRGKACLSRIMQWILSVFAKRYNKMTHQTGHVWQGRFSSTIIESVKHYYNVFTYIALNPVKAGLCEKAVDYKYSGFSMVQAGYSTGLLDYPGYVLEWLKTKSGFNRI